MRRGKSGGVARAGSVGEGGSLRSLVPARSPASPPFPRAAPQRQRRRAGVRGRGVWGRPAGSPAGWLPAGAEALWEVTARRGRPSSLAASSPCTPSPGERGGRRSLPVPSPPSLLPSPVPGLPMSVSRRLPRPCPLPPGPRSRRTCAVGRLRSGSGTSGGSSAAAAGGGCSRSALRVPVSGRRRGMEPALSAFGRSGAGSPRLRMGAPGGAWDGGGGRRRRRVGHDGDGDGDGADPTPPAAPSPPAAGGAAGRVPPCPRPRRRGD